MSTNAGMKRKSMRDADSAALTEMQAKLDECMRERDEYMRQRDKANADLIKVVGERNELGRNLKDAQQMVTGLEAELRMETDNKTYYRQSSVRAHQHLNMVGDSIPNIPDSHLLYVIEFGRQRQARLEAEGKRRRANIAREEAVTASPLLEACQCPITRAAYEDPVVAGDGHTYERSALMRLFGRNKDAVSPISRQVISRDGLVPNYVVKKTLDIAREKQELVWTTAGHDPLVAAAAPGLLRAPLREYDVEEEDWPKPAVVDLCDDDEMAEAGPAPSGSPTYSPAGSPGPV